MTGLPTGIVTFLFTDIEGSTRLALQDPEKWEIFRQRHHTIMQSVMQAGQGYIFHEIGDAFCVAFWDACQAVRVALEAQADLAREDWGNSPIKVRIGIHTGKADLLQTGDYAGYLTLSRVQRLMSAGHGGQTLVSQDTRDIVSNNLPANISLRDLGEYRLKDLVLPEHIFQVEIPGLPADFPALNSLQARRDNLPTQLTPFIGRGKEIASLVDLLCRPDIRLVTLTGPGGTGKTRLSVQLANLLFDQFLDGIFFVSLAETTQRDLAVSRIAQILEVREGNGQHLLNTIVDYLRDKTILLVLDNYEQLVGAASLVTDLLAGAPKLKLLVSSRIVLRIRGEHEFPLSPLEVPFFSDLPDLNELQQNESIQLFIQRAQAANPAFSLTGENAQPISAICRSLDGLPLAIELAAARVKILPPQAMLSRLNNRLSFLTGGGRDLPTRQQTLRNTLDWSYGLLDNPEKVLFDRLGIFAGGFNFDAVEAICNQDGALDVLSGVEALVDNSLVRQDGDYGGQNRFVMLATIREYALEQLEKGTGLGELTRTHARYYIFKITTEMGPRLFSADSVSALNWFESEFDNIRSALAWALEDQEIDEYKPELLLNLSWFWFRRGYLHEGRTWAEKFMRSKSAVPGTLAHAGILLSSAMLALWQADVRTALLESVECLAMFQRQEDERFLPISLLNQGIIHINMGKDAAAHPFLKEAAFIFKEQGNSLFHAIALVHLGNVALGLGNPSEALEWLEQAYPIASKVGDPWTISFALNNLGEVARVQGDYGKAQRYYKESEELLRSMGDQGDLARLVHNLGCVAQHEGNLEKAREAFLESLAMFRKFGNRRGIAECLMGFSGLLAQEDSQQLAARLHGAAEAIIMESGTAWWPADRGEVEQTRALIRSKLGDLSFQNEFEFGQKMPLDQAFASTLGQS